mgnify:CR=1 FL=1
MRTIGKTYLLGHVPAEVVTRQIAPVFGCLVLPAEVVMRQIAPVYGCLVVPVEMLMRYIPSV